MIFGGIIPAFALTRLFPGRTGLRTRLAGVVLFSLLAGAAVTAFLQYGTGSLSGDYWFTALGLSLGMAALSMTFIGLEAATGLAGLGAGAGVMMLLGNPLSGLGTGPYWLHSGWATVGQLLPPGASGSLLRANAFFDGTGSAAPALILTAWVVLGLALLLLVLVAARRKRRPPSPPQQPQSKKPPRLEPALTPDPGIRHEATACRGPGNLLKIALRGPGSPAVPSNAPSKSWGSGPGRTRPSVRRAVHPHRNQDRTGWGSTGVEAGESAAFAASFRGGGDEGAQAVADGGEAVRDRVE
ncbi:hypothetical protein ACIRQP_41940 [Streptomyces sp. NPDC102274]|uniref:hypothetical protein n=1 Tax=Streptomyces sp. NPDC102274 TaxID=3366151 RepID=UPI003827F378